MRSRGLFAGILMTMVMVPAHVRSVQVASTTVIAGVVAEDRSGSSPVAGAIVSILDAQGRRLESSLSDSEGRFSVAGLREVRVRVRAEKPGHLSNEFGATKPGRAGLVLSSSARRFQHIVVELPRAAAITGVVSDEAGVPLPGVEVGLLQETTTSAAGSSRWSGVPRPLARTDERGRFRVPGLDAGTYLVGATPGLMGAGNAGRPLTRGDIDRARKSDRASIAEPLPAPERFVTTFHPSEVSADHAAVVTVERGRTVDGVDIRMRRLPVFSVAGAVVDERAVPVAAALTLVPVGAHLPAGERSLGVASARSMGGAVSLTTRANGRYRIDSLVPGEYVMVSQTLPDRSPTLWARQAFHVGSGDTEDLDMIVRPGATVTGAIISAVPLPKVEVRLGLEPDSLEPGTALPGQTRISLTEEASVSFSISSLPPGRYRLTVAGLPRGWFARAARLGDRDLLDLPVGLEPAARYEGLRLELSNTPSNVRGHFSDAAGRPATDYVVILFPADQRLWLPGARRIRADRPDSAGRFEFTPLPAGEYRLAAAWDVAPGEWFDPAFLDALLPSSIPVTLADGERRTQDIRVAGGGSPAPHRRP